MPDKAIANCWCYLSEPGYPPTHSLYAEVEQNYISLTRPWSVGARRAPKRFGLILIY